MHKKETCFELGQIENMYKTPVRSDVSLKIIFIFPVEVRRVLYTNGTYIQ